MAQNAIFASFAIAGGMIVACIADIVTDLPFGGQVGMDVMFMVASGIVLWMGFDCFKSVRRK